MSVILKDSSNVTKYTFPSGVELKDEPWGQRLDSEPKAYAHGDVTTADKKVSSRVISLHGIFQKTSAALMETELKSMRKACYTKDYRLYATQNANEFYEIECFNFDFDYLGILTTVEVIVDFLAADGFRYYKDQTTDTKNPVVSGTPYTVNNGGDTEVSPVITYTAGGTQTKVKIQNDQDAGKYFEYTGSLALNDILKIDCQEGTVEKNGVDDIANFSAGSSFINLASGDNTITVTVTGTLGTSICVFKFRKRWL